MTASNGALAPSSPIDAAVAAFLAEAIVEDKSDAGFTSTAELVAAARQWCDEKNEYRFGARALARHLRRNGFQQWNTGRIRGWKGVRLR